MVSAGKDFRVPDDAWQGVWICRIEALFVKLRPWLRYIHVFYRHTDKDTGVAPWWQPFDVSRDFPFIGVGKKGGC